MEKNQQKPSKSMAQRIMIYIIGVFIQCFGIVLCVKCQLGISPINSIPYVVSKIIPLTLGILSIFFYLINIAIQFILSEKKYYPSIILQLPISFLFGFVIDFWDAILPNATNIFTQILFLCGSVFFTAFGIMVLVAMNLVLDPPTGTIQAISRVTSKSIGSVKVIYDCVCVIVSVLIGFISTHHLVGFGIATIISALFVGRVLSLLQKTVGRAKILN